MTKILKRLFNLQKIASRQAGTPEGDNAAAMVVKLKSYHGLELDDDALDLHEETLAFENDWERDVAHLICGLLPVDATVLDDSAVFRGMKVAVLEAVKHHHETRKEIDRLIFLAVMGHMVGRFGLDTVEACAMEHRGSHNLSKGIEVVEEEMEKSREPSGPEASFVRQASSLAKPITLWDDLR